MEHKFYIYCTNTASQIEVEGGETLLDIYKRLSIPLTYPAVTARVNYKSEGLDYRVYNPCDVEFVDITDPSGMRAYVRSLCFVLYKAISELHPGSRLRIEHSISHGNYCVLKNGNTPLTEENIKAIKQRMQEIIAENIPFERKLAHTEEVIEIFRKQNMLEKVALLKSIGDLYTNYYLLDNLADIYYSWLVPSTGYLSVFDLVPYSEGMLLLPPDTSNPSRPASIINQQKMLRAFGEYIDFNHIVGLDGVGKLNCAIEENRASELIQVAEALHEKKIAHIAEEIATRFKKGGARIVLISGPSSSGKTTFSKRLSVQLMTNLITPAAISLDDYFVNRQDTPRDEYGDYDYESLYALDLERFNSDLNRLLAGERVALPTYDFKSGSRIETGRTMQLTPNTVLIMEGIHGLNPDLTPHIPEHQKFRIYVSALTSLSKIGRASCRERVSC